MFGFFHARTKSILVYVLFGAIALVFIGFNYYGTHTVIGGNAARVNDSVITQNEYRQAIDQMNRMYSQFLGGGASNPQQQKFIQEMAMDRLVTQILVSEQTERHGVTVTDQEIRDWIFAVPAFQNEGQFQREYYMNFLQSQNMTASQFENRIRRDLVFEKAQRLLSDSLTPSSMESALKAKASQQQLNLGYIGFSAESMAKQVKVSSDQIADALKNPKVVADSEAYFKQNRPRYQTEEQVKARHILIKAVNESPSELAKALERTQAIRKRLDKESFEKVAKEVSQDPGSQKQGGDLGTFGKGKMVPEFESVAFQAKIGEISQPVKSPFGYHLIRVDAKIPAQDPSFEQIKAKVVGQVLAEQSGQKQIDALRDVVKTGNGGQIEALVRSAGLTWADTGWFGRFDESIPVLGSAEDQIGAVAELTVQNPYMKRLISNGTQFYIVKLKETRNQPAAALDLAQRPIGGEVFMSWTSQLKAKAKITKSAQLEM